MITTFLYLANIVVDLPQQLDFSLLFSFAGFIFGLSGLLVSLRSILREKPNIEILCVDKYANISRRHPDNRELQGLFKVLIINKSSLAITIYKVMNSEQEHYLNRSSTYPNKVFSGYYGKGMHTIDFFDSIEIPLTIPPYGAIENYLYFYRFPHKNKGEEVTLFFHTPSKVFKFTTTIESSASPY